MRTDARDLKAKVDIVEVLEKVGGRAEFGDYSMDEIKVFCPFCSDSVSRRPAGRANWMKGLYHCWACGFGGDIFDIAERYLSEENQDADDELFGAFGPAFDDCVAWIEREFTEPEEAEDPWSTES